MNHYTGVTVPVASGWSNTKTIAVESCINPTDITFSNITNNSAKVSWTDLGCNSSYILEYKKESASTWTTINAISNTEYTLTGLQTATDYNVRVKSDCGSLTPVIPTAFNFTTASSSASCSSPTNITAGSITSTGATISWTAASNAQNYKVEYKKSSETNWTIGTSSTTSTNYQITGLVASTGYNVRISTRCSNGATSSNSTTVTFTTSAPEPCGVPTNVYAYAFSTQQARITWDAPTSNTNINSYTFEYKKDGATIWNTVTSNTTSINLTGLTINTTYNARISTNCTGGATSASTETVTFTTLASGCYGYTPVITVLSQTPNYAQISWSAVSTSSLYMVEYRKWHSNASDSWIVATPSTSSTYYTFNTLETNLVYSVRITALCEDGSIQQRSETIFYLDNGCHAPQDLTINDITSKSARFVYDYLSCNKSTKVEYKKSNEQTWTFVKEYATYFSCHVIDYLTGLTPNTSYDVRVTPSCGNSVTKAFITRDICAPPADIQVSDITAGSARISYSRASNATNYIYEYKRQSDANWTKFYNLDLGNNWVILTGLESANNYLVRITSSCVWDYNNSSQTSSEFSDASIEKSFTTNCQAMSSFSLSASQSQILVSWSSIFGANEYTVQYRRQSDVFWTSKPNTTATSLALTSLESATVYVVRIIVNCINGSSSSSNEQTVTTPSSSNNDECSGAIDLPTCSNTPLTGTTLGKTLSSIRPPINSSGYPDVWYKFTATARIHRITTYHSSTNDASQQMIVGVVGDCNNPTSSLRSYINSNFYTSRTSSFDVYGLVTGTTYYVYVAGQNIDFTICTEDKTESAAPSNDAQSGAIILSTAAVGAGCGASVNGSTVGATNLYSNVYRSDVWFKYTAVSGRHKYKFTNIRSLTGTNYGDFALSISPNGGSISYGYNYIPSNTSRTFYNSTDQTVGQDYYLNVGGAGMGFDLCTEAVTWSPAPPNDESNTATNLSEINNCANGTTLGSNDGKVWFKFVATKTTHVLTINNTKNQDGAALVTLSPTLYKGSNLEIVSNLNMSNYTYPYTGNFTQALNNLTIGETYYILICGGCGGALTTTLYLTYNICVDVPILNIWSGTTNSCQTTTSVTLTPNTWNMIADNNGLIALINPKSQDLSLTSAGIYVNQGTVRTTISNSAYLDRNYTFNFVSQPTSAVSVRLFFKKADYDALKAADPNIISTASLRITRVSGEATNCTNSFIVNNGQTSTILTGTVVPYGNDYFIEFETSSFSNFFIHAVNTPLPVELLNFQAHTTKDGNLLTWQTAMEVNTSHFDIEHSSDGKSYQKTGETKAQGKAATYEYIDRHPLSITTYYRLKMNDLDGKFSYSNVVSISQNRPSKIKIYPNPTRHDLTIDLGDATQATIRLIDILGREVLQKQGQSGQVLLDMSSIVRGIYFAEITAKGVFVREKVVKN